MKERRLPPLNNSIRFRFKLRTKAAEPRLLYVRYEKCTYVRVPYVRMRQREFFCKVPSENRLTGGCRHIFESNRISTLFVTSDRILYTHPSFRLICCSPSHLCPSFQSARSEPSSHSTINRFDSDCSQPQAAQSKHSRAAK